MPQDKTGPPAFGWRWASRARGFMVGAVCTAVGVAGCLMLGASAKLLLVFVAGMAFITLGGVLIVTLLMHEAQPPPNE